MLSTRVVQRRALRTSATVRRRSASSRSSSSWSHVSSVGPSGKTTVTAFLHPQAHLAEVFALRGNMALARVTYTGIPSGMGQMKDTVVLLSGTDDIDSHDLPGC